jgi:hypothetical protein
VIPAGPSVADEIANAAFFVGLMSAGEQISNIPDLLSFDDAKRTSSPRRATVCTRASAGSSV